MPTYVDAINTILKHEGGFVDHKLDKGGATNFGITKKVYEEFVGRTVTVDEIRNMPKGNAVAIYKKNYWDKVKGDSIKDYAVALLIFDAAVNSGISNAVKLAQKILGIAQDGIAGNEFIKHLNGFDSKKFTSEYLKGREAFYRKIVENNPKQEVFLRGWLKRVEDNAKLVSKWIGTPVGKVTVGVGLFALLGLGFFLFLKLRKK